MTDQSGIKETITNLCGENDILQFINLLEMESVDEPKQEALQGFIDDLKEKIKTQINLINNQEESKRFDFSNKVIDKFGKDTLFKKYLTTYKELIKRK